MKPLAKFIIGVLLPMTLAAGPATAQLTQETSLTGEAAMMDAGHDAKQIAAIRQVPSVGVIRLNMRVVPSMLNEDDFSVSGMRIAAQQNAAGIARLRAALAHNPVTRAALEAHGINISRVVGVKIGSNGSLRIYLL
jgi:hypothetical protein